MKILQIDRRLEEAHLSHIKKPNPKMMIRPCIDFNLFYLSNKRDVIMCIVLVTIRTGSHRLWGIGWIVRQSHWTFIVCDEGVRFIHRVKPVGQNISTLKFRSVSWNVTIFHMFIKWLQNKSTKIEYVLVIEVRLQRYIITKCTQIIRIVWCNILKWNNIARMK